MTWQNGETQNQVEWAAMSLPGFDVGAELSYELNDLVYARFEYIKASSG
jgi:hypothetical protein